MDFQKHFKVFLKRVGAETVVTIGAEQTAIRALVEPMRYKNKMYLNMPRSEAGFKDEECFLYIGPPVPDFSGREEETIVQTMERSYNVSRASKISLGKEALYIWAVLTPRVKDGVYDNLQ